MFQPRHPRFGGRRSLLDDKVKGKLLTALKCGNYRSAACAYAGVSRPSFYEWMARGAKEKKGVYAQLVKDVLEAEEQAEAQIVMIWRTQIPQDYRAARDFLERRYPSRWARREILTHEGLPPPTTPTKYDLSKLNADEWQQFKQLREKMTRSETLPS